MFVVDSQGPLPVVELHDAALPGKEHQVLAGVSGVDAGELRQLLGAEGVVLVDELCRTLRSTPD